MDHQLEEQKKKGATADPKDGSTANSEDNAANPRTAAQRGQSLLETEKSDFDLMNVVAMRASQEELPSADAKANNKKSDYKGAVASKAIPQSKPDPSVTEKKGMKVASKGILAPEKHQAIQDREQQQQPAGKLGKLYPVNMIQPLPSAAHRSGIPEQPAASGSELSGSSRQSVPGAYTGVPGSSMRRVGDLNFSLVGSTTTTTCNLPSHASTEMMSSRSGNDTTIQEHASNLAPLPRELQGLAVANMIAESSKKILGVAEEYNESNKNQPTTGPRKSSRVMGLGCLCLTVAVVLVVVLLLLLSPGNTDDLPKQTSFKTTQAPSPAPSLSPKNSILSLFPEDTKQSMEKPNSPQAKAFEWLLEDVETNLLSEERIKQRYALATLYYATRGPHWFRNGNWLNHSAHECLWYSVGTLHDYEDVPHLIQVTHNSSCEQDPQEHHRVEEDGTIQHIWLQYNNLEGELPREFFLLTNIRSVNLDGCFIGGTFPHQFSDLSNLESLSLMANNLEGTLPPSLFARTNFSDFSISYNLLTGTIPTQVGMSKRLVHLLLDGNHNISGTLPSESGLLTNLEWLYIDSLQLEGTIPTEVGLMTSMVDFFGYYNLFTGTIPIEIAQLRSTLSGLELEGNQLSGPLPSELGLLTEVKTFSLFENSLIGSIPTECGKLTKTTFFSLDVNELTGLIPTQLGLLSNAHDFALFENRLSGSIPTELAQLTSARVFALDVNELTDLIPTQIGLMTNLEILTLHDNYLTGWMPTELAMLSNLTWMGLHSNDLTGEIPSEFGLLENMEKLELEFNDLLGAVPEELGWLASLEKVTLQGNDLSGEIPEGLCQVNQTVFNCTETLCGCDCQCNSAGEGIEVVIINSTTSNHTV